jgi:hypothetical protein
VDYAKASSCCSVQSFCDGASLELTWKAGPPACSALGGLTTPALPEQAAQSQVPPPVPHEQHAGAYDAQEFATANAPELGMQTVPSLNITYTEEKVGRRRRCEGWRGGAGFVCGEGAPVVGRLHVQAGSRSPALCPPFISWQYAQCQPPQAHIVPTHAHPQTTHHPLPGPHPPDPPCGRAT